MSTHTSVSLVPRRRTGLPVRATATAWLAVTLAMTVGPLSGCSGGTPTPQLPVVTLTAPPTVTPSIPAPTSRTTRPSVPRSDDVGRRFDLGTIVKRENHGGVPVLIFDRWSARGVPDSKLAATGVPIRVHSDAPFTNVNTRKTFRIPVVPGAIFTYNHCVSIDLPAQQRSSTLQELASLPTSENIILLSLDPLGQVFKAANEPAC